MTIEKNTTPKRKKYLEKDNTQGKLQLIIGSNIFHWRKYRGMTQKELADKSALTQSIISDLENGDYNPSIEVLQKIAQALEVEYEVLNKQHVTRKMIEIVDYMTRQLEEIGTLKAMKLLYLIDFESLQKNGQKLIGLDYIRWNRGPFNKEIYDAEKIFATTKVNYKAQVFKSYLTLEKEDAKFIDMILEKYGHMESINLMRYTYTTKPMEGCTLGGSEKMGEKIL